MPDAHEDAAIVQSALATAARQGVDDDMDMTETIRPAATPPTIQDKALPLALCVNADDPRAGIAELVIQELLGQGAMGTVHTARERALRREVAVKRLRHRGPKRAAALRDEARLTGALEHPNIIPVHGLLRTKDDEPLMIMKRAEGHTWRSLIRKSGHPAMAPWRDDPLDRHLEILVQVCRAMEFAHSRGVLHLDLKPANVMVGDFGATWLMDWGVAIRVVEKEDLPDREVAGTPAYLAPEMLEGRQLAEERSDVFLLGACLHEVLTRQPRHTGHVLAAVFGAALKCEPAEYDEGVSAELGRIANRACSKDPAERFDSVATFRTAIEAYRRRRGARELLHAAHRKRAELVAELDQPAPAPERVGRLTSASRFAYEQVLEQWPESEAASKALQDVLVRAVRFELGRDNIGAVAVLLDALPKERPDLRERYLQRADALAAEMDARARLEDLHRQAAFHGKDWNRVVGIVANGAVWFVLLTIWAWATRTGRVVNTPLFNLQVGLGGGVVVALLIAAFRRLFLDNQMRRSFTAAYGVFCLALLLNRIAGWQLDVPFLHVLIADHAVLLCFFGMLAARGLSTLWAATGLTAVGILAIGAYPGEALQIGAFTVLGVNAVLAWALRPGAETTLQP